jgi:Protein of unknown function (DUF4239)
MNVFVESALLVGAAAALGVAGVLAANRWLSVETRQQYRDATDVMRGFLSTSIGLLLAFTVVTMWTRLESARATVQEEATQLQEIFRLAQGWPDAEGRQVREQAREYARLLIEEEWAALAEDRTSPRAEAVLARLWELHADADRQPGGGGVFFGESTRRLAQLDALRQQRIHAATRRIAPLLWVVLLGSAAVLGILVCITGTSSLRSQLVVMLAVVWLTTSALVFIRAYNRPFRGDVRADVTPFERTLAHSTASSAAEAVDHAHVRPAVRQGDRLGVYRAVPPRGGGTRPCLCSRPPPREGVCPKHGRIAHTRRGRDGQSREVLHGTPSLCPGGQRSPAGRGILRSHRTGTTPPRLRHSGGPPCASSLPCSCSRRSTA